MSTVESMKANEGRIVNPMAYIMSKIIPDSLIYIGAAAPTATVFGIIINLAYFMYFSKQELIRTGEMPARD